MRKYKYGLIALFLTMTFLINHISKVQEVEGMEPRMKIEEEDGSPSGRPRTFKQINGTLVDNGNGTFTFRPDLKLLRNDEHDSAVAIWFSDGIYTDNTYEYTPGAGWSCEGTKLKDNDINTGSIQVAENAGATTLVDRSVTDTPGAGTEQSDAFLIDSQLVAKSYGEADGSGGVKNLWWHVEKAMRIKPQAIADSPVGPQEGCFWWDNDVDDSGLNVYLNGQWQRVATDIVHHGGLMYISTAGTVTVDTGLEYQKVSGGSIAYTVAHLDDFSHSAGTLTYTGVRDIHFMIAVHVSLESGEAGGQEVSIRIAKDGSTIAETDMELTFTAQNAHRSASTMWIEEFSTGEYVEIFVTSDVSSDDVIFNNMVVTITEQ